MTRPNNTLLEVLDAKKHYPLTSRPFSRAESQAIHAVDGVHLSVAAGETLSVVGESGCGKSTLGRVILGLTDLTAGEIWFDGQRIDNLPPRAFRKIRRRIQVVFQDPFSSLNPRMTVRDIICEPLTNFQMATTRAALDDRVNILLDQVHLAREAASRYPHEFSGGQRQRIGIARALASSPDLIICDEAVSALDVSVKAQILNLLSELQDRLNIALLFISHDLAVVEHLSHRVAVMYLGKVVEIGSRDAIFTAPTHPYTQALLSAVPNPNPAARVDKIVLRGDIPSPVNPPPGCRFKSRCPYVFDRCRTEEPRLRERGTGQSSACHLDELPKQQSVWAASEKNAVVPVFTVAAASNGQ